MTDIVERLRHMRTRSFWIWHMHLGERGDLKAMSCVEIPCTPLWFWKEADEAERWLQGADRYMPQTEDEAAEAMDNGRNTGGGTMRR
jgi:hypothetical protein